LNDWIKEFNSTIPRFRHVIKRIYKNMLITPERISEEKAQYKTHQLFLVSQFLNMKKNIEH